jgi:hypothetical protein
MGWRFSNRVKILPEGLHSLGVFILLVAIVLTPSIAHAGCFCQCVENVERAVCDSVEDEPSVCGRRSCPVAPLSAKPPDTGRAVPPGTYGCEFMRVYTFGRYERAELCESSSRNNTALIKPGSYVVPGRRAPYRSQSGQTATACNSDSDCPAGTACSRTSMNEGWHCMRR